VGKLISVGGSPTDRKAAGYGVTRPKKVYRYLIYPDIGLQDNFVCSYFRTRPYTY